MTLLQTVKRALKNPPKAPFDPERQAVAYARWLAARDGVALPSEATIKWSMVHVGGKKVKRARAVTFMSRPHYRYAPRGGLAHCEAEPVTIEIPHWDHVPTCEARHDEA